MTYLFLDLLYVLKEHLKYLFEKMYCWCLVKTAIGRNAEKAIIALKQKSPPYC